MALSGFLPLSDEALLAQCTEMHLRGSGPGGQKRNKTSSAVRLVHRPTGLQVMASDDRSQRINKLHALRRLREAIALDLRTPVTLEDIRPSALLREIVGREARPPKLTDRRFFELAAELLDALDASRGRVAEASAALGITTGLLNKLLRLHRRAWRKACEIRARHGHSPLR